MTIQMSSSLHGSKWFWENKHTFLDARDLWDHYLMTVGRGGNLIINMPPNIYGGVPPKYRAAGKGMGDAVRASFTTPAAAVTNATVACGTGASPLVLAIPSTAHWNSFVCCCGGSAHVLTA